MPLNLVLYCWIQVFLMLYFNVKQKYEYIFQRGWRALYMPVPSMPRMGINYVFDPGFSGGWNNLDASF
jgi:hypothetical protein